MSNIIFEEIMIGYDKSIYGNNYRPELLAPAGNLEKLKVALRYGADAVYLSGKKYGLRAQAKNFTQEEIAKACEIAHVQDKRVYVTVNIFPRHNDIDELPAYLHELQNIGIDGLIISDPGIILLAKQYAPEIPIHLSTQANTTNYLSARFWASQGVTRINLARELTWDEIVHIRNKITIELELFVHGSMCMAYSGRCFLSSYLTGRSANLGDCAQPCRWKYSLLEEKRPGQYFPVFSDDRGSYILSSKDLCLISHMDKLLNARIDAFKLEGRMRGILAVATMVRIYRAAIDTYLENPSNYSVDPNWVSELNKISHREYFTGLIFNEEEVNSFTSESYIRPYTLAGIVKEIVSTDKNHTTTALVEARNPLKKGEILEFLGDKDTTFRWLANEFVLTNGEKRDEAKPNELIKIRVPFPLFRYQIIRKKSAE